MGWEENERYLGGIGVTEVGLGKGSSKIC